MLRSLIIATLLVVSSFATAQTLTPEPIGESGAWKAYRYTNPGSEGLVCFIAAEPETMEGNYTSRGPVYLQITHRQSPERAANKLNVISFNAGFQFPENHQPLITIGTAQFRMHTESGTAWSFPADDTELTQALRDGASVQIDSKSWRGTEIRDTFSLRGVTAMHNLMSESCGVDPI